MFVIYNRARDTFHVHTPDGWQNNLAAETAKYLLADKLDVRLGHAERMLDDARDAEAAGFGFNVEYNPRGKRRRWRVKGSVNSDSRSLTAKEVKVLLHGVSPRIARHLMRAARLLAKRKNTRTAMNA